MGHKVPQSQYFHGLWHSFFFSTVKDGILQWMHANVNTSREFYPYLLMMAVPSALLEPHFCKYCIKGGSLRTARIHADADPSRPLIQVRDPHLFKVHAVIGVLHTVVALPPAQPVIHVFLLRRDIRCRPVGVTAVRHHAPQPLVLFIFILNGRLQPVREFDSCIIKIVRAGRIKPVLFLSSFSIYYLVIFSDM